MRRRNCSIRRIIRIGTSTCRRRSGTCRSCRRRASTISWAAPRRGCSSCRRAMRRRRRTSKNSVISPPPPEAFAMAVAAKICLAAILFAAAAIAPSRAQPVEQALSLAKKEQHPLLETLEALVSIESGSRDVEGLERIAKLIAGRLQALGGQVELVEAS